MPDGDYAGFVERHVPPRGPPGADRRRRRHERWARHGGVHRFTVGQRRGLGVTSARPLYVLAVLPASRTVVVGEAEPARRARPRRARRELDLDRSAPVGAARGREDPLPRRGRGRPAASAAGRTRRGHVRRAAAGGHARARPPSSTRARSAWAAAGSTRPMRIGQSRTSENQGVAQRAALTASS